jgi:hypothetical protein
MTVIVNSKTDYYYKKFIKHEFTNFISSGKFLGLMIEPEFAPQYNLNNPLKKLSNKKIRTCLIDAVPKDWLIPNPSAIILTDNKFFPGTYDPKYYEQVKSSFYGGMYFSDVKYDIISPIKHYNCFISRMDPIRQSWLYQLIRRNIFDQGYVSFNMDTRVDTGMTDHEMFEQYFKDHLTIFESEHRFIRDKVPYRNFDDDTGPAQLIMQSKFSIVLETYFERNEIIALSEKIFRCLRLPRPWVLFAAKNSVEHLREMGFDVLDDVVDHRYDLIDSPIERQVKILDVAQELCNLNYTSLLASRLLRAANHNQQLLSTMYDNFKDDFIKSVASAKMKYMDLIQANS